MALMALGIDIILPAFDDIRSSFNLPDSGGQERQIITIYFVGLAIAQLFFGPLSDWFGRKPVLYIGICIYLVGAIGSALAPSFSLLMTARFVWGIGAAGSRVVAVAIIRDSFEGTAWRKPCQRSWRCLCSSRSSPPHWAQALSPCSHGKEFSGSV